MTLTWIRFVGLFGNTVTEITGSYSHGPLRAETQPYCGDALFAARTLVWTSFMDFQASARIRRLLREFRGWSFGSFETSSQLSNRTECTRRGSVPELNHGTLSFPIPPSKTGNGAAIPNCMILPHLLNGCRF
jgi:hypothetical protein